MKILIDVELNKGYIPSDKINRRGISLEIFSLENFDKKHLSNDKLKRMVKNFKTKEEIKQLKEYLKFFIVRSKHYKNILKIGYHTHLYLNINKDGIDCFISR